MEIEKLRMVLALDQHDYFFVKSDLDKTYTISLTDNQGGPVHLTNISRKQIYGLLAQAQRCVLAGDEEEAFKLKQPELAHAQ